MKIISWNVNGLRACVTKGFINFFNETFINSVEETSSFFDILIVTDSIPKERGKEIM